MKKLTIILLLLQGCSEPEIPQKVFGDWSISWQVDEYYRTGHLILNNDFTGTITVEENPTAFILPNKEKIDFKWSYSEQTLLLKRSDNDFELTYNISEKTENQIVMHYADGIIVTLLR